jgi:hypothetical protein
MKFSVGDKVIVKHTKEEGKVVELINDQMVEVEVLNTRFPAFTDELEHPYLDWFTSKKMNARKRALSLDDFPAEHQVSAAEGAKMHSGMEPGFHMAFLPVYHFDAQEEELAKLKLYFINQTEYTLKLKYDCVTALGKEFSFGTTVYPYQHLYLHHIRFDLVNERLHFDFEIRGMGKEHEYKLLEHQLKIKPKQIFQKIQQIQEQNQPLFHWSIASDFPIIDTKELTKDLWVPKAKPANIYQFKKRPKLSTTVDLHIEHLLDDYIGLGNFEKLSAQLQACEEAVLDAVHHQQPSIIIVHGVGSGKLKEEVHALLKRMKKEVRLFENKYSSKYGFGATEVFLRY